MIPIINLSASTSINNDILENYYKPAHLQRVLQLTLDYMDSLSVVVGDEHRNIAYPYFCDLSRVDWLARSKTLDVYITDIAEGRMLNEQARGKDYATNILSYPSDLPSSILQQLPEIVLGELIVCHDVVEDEASTQGKNTADHITHLLVHGVLHLLGFDHELGQEQQDEMEHFEVEILKKLGVENPYE